MLRLAAQRYSSVSRLQHLRKMHVEALRLLWNSEDNYCFIVIDEKTYEGAVIDPASPLEILPRLRELEKQGFKLTSIINTHYHNDHSAGNATFRELYPNVPLYAGKDSPFVTDTPPDGGKFSVGNLEVTALYTPCHTRDSICWRFVDSGKNQHAVFTGDTLFICGCGKFFEGDANDMLGALTKLGNIQADTVVYPGHEYTPKNVRFALTVDPDNKATQKVAEYCKSHDSTTGVFSIGDELKANPFMRTDDPGLQKKLGTLSAVSTMAKLRQMKDNFK